MLHIKEFKSSVSSGMADLQVDSCIDVRRIECDGTEEITLSIEKPSIGHTLNYYNMKLITDAQAKKYLEKIYKEVAPKF